MRSEPVLPPHAAKVIRAFLDAYDKADEALQPVYQSAWIHGVKYRGPNITPQLTALRKLVEAASRSAREGR